MSQRKFAVIVTIVALAVSAIGAGLLIYKNNEDKKQENPETAVNPTSNPQDTKNQDVSIEPVEEDNGDEPPESCTKKYTNANFPNFSFEYDGCVFEVSEKKIYDSMSNEIQNLDIKLFSKSINEVYLNFYITPYRGGDVNRYYLTEDDVTKISDDIGRFRVTGGYSYTLVSIGEEIKIVNGVENRIPKEIYGKFSTNPALDIPHSTIVIETNTRDAAIVNEFEKIILSFTY
jgi:hypothetical protein